MDILPPRKAARPEPKPIFLRYGDQQFAPEIRGAPVLEAEDILPRNSGGAGRAIESECDWRGNGGERIVTGAGNPHTVGAPYRAKTRAGLRRSRAPHVVM